MASMTRLARSPVDSLRRSLKTRQRTEPGASRIDPRVSADIMDSVALWATVVVVITAAVIDIFTRRIPNWLSLPFLVAGVAVSTVQRGMPGMVSSIAGIGLATAVMGVFW